MVKAIQEIDMLLDEFIVQNLEQSLILEKYNNGGCLCPYLRGRSDGDLMYKLPFPFFRTYMKLFITNDPSRARHFL